MSKTNLHKYINLLIRVLLGVAALVFVIYKLLEAPYVHPKNLNWNITDYSLLLLCLFLVFLNWGIEASKWKYLIRDFHPIPLKKSMSIIFSSITIGILTPNRVAEIPAKAFLLQNTANKKQVIFATLIGAYCQMVVTLIVGGIALFYTISNFEFIQYPKTILSLCFGASLFSLVLLFKSKGLISIWRKIPFLKEKKLWPALTAFKKKELLTALLFSTIRYFVFFSQYFILLFLFNIPLFTLPKAMLIAVCFMVTSFIPTIVLSEIGIRSSVALYVFGTISDDNIAILYCTLLLWIINVALPALLGILYLKNLHFFKRV